MSYNKDTKMYEGYIYKIYNDVNNKIYIGQTIRTVKERWAQHKSVARTHVDSLVLHSAMNKYGIDNFHIELIEEHSFNTMEELCKVLNDKEIYYINQYQTKTPTGYNITEGGDGARGAFCREIVCYNPYTKETCFYKSIDEAALDNNVPSTNIIACCKGEKYSIGSKIYKYKEYGISQDDIEKYFDLHPIISQFNLSGDKLNTFIVSIDAANFLKDNDNLTQAASTIAKHITDCCNGNRQTAYGYVWRKMEDNFNKYPLRLDYPRNSEKNTEKPIDVYTINGDFIGTFDNVKIAFKTLDLMGKQTNQALRCCSGKAAIAFGYVWRYRAEPFNKYSCAIINGTLRVNKYTQDGVFVDTYGNYLYAARSVNTTNKKAISDCCNNENHLYRGFLWFHINDKKQPDKTKIIY